MPLEGSPSCVLLCSPPNRRREDGDDGLGTRASWPDCRSQMLRPCGGRPPHLSHFTSTSAASPDTPNSYMRKRAFAVGLAPMHEIQPRKIIQMAMRAGRQETGGNDRCGLGLRRAVVDIARLVGAIGQDLGLK